ncbi:MAG: hypothetical protein KatS3mg105_2183 [Gemmatales bacterium]|nr:MAG: hypothetical protein KatS3mg105_2183 [Gemmatales bacterium]
MRTPVRFLFIVAAALLPASLRAVEPPKMKFNEVKEVVPGVFFRYSSIDFNREDDIEVPFGGSNHAWIVFEDYVVVIDANFPSNAEKVIADIKKTTKKPIRYVLDTHHHGDHAYGNAVFIKEGATVIAHRECVRWLREKGAREYADAARGPMGREDLRRYPLKIPTIVFDDKLVLDDGKQRVEFLHFGHAHTPGDAVAYLPRHKILITGDACPNGPFSYTGHSDTASWIRVLERMQGLDIDLVFPGHGPITTKEVLAKKKRYFIELRQQVQKGIDAGKSIDEIIKSIDMPWYKEWTGVPANSRVENIRHVYGELTGLVTPPALLWEFQLHEGPSPTREDKGWTKPKRIVVPNLMPARLAELKRLAPEIEFVPVKTAEEAAREAADADAVVGFCTPDIIRAGKNLRWIQVRSAGVEHYLTPELVKSDIVLTNTQKIYGPNVADQAFALLLMLTRKSHKGLQPRPAKTPLWQWLRDVEPVELHGKTMLVVGLGGIGTQVARRAHGFGMRVYAIDPASATKPDFVSAVYHPDRLDAMLPKADVVVVSCPLTKKTQGMFAARQFKAMKPTAFFINVARGRIVHTPDLVAALENKTIAGAGLDVVDPEPLPDEHPLWRLPNCVISPHLGGQAPQAMVRRWLLFRENIRRFVEGERLLGVVDKQKGY